MCLQSISILNQCINGILMLHIVNSNIKLVLKNYGAKEANITLSSTTKLLIYLIFI